MGRYHHAAKSAAGHCSVSLRQQLEQLNASSSTPSSSAASTSASSVAASSASLTSLSSSTSYANQPSPPYLGSKSSLLPPPLAAAIPPFFLTPPDPVPRDRESTRLQLQRQRLRDQVPPSLSRAAIPGFRTSAAFLASLRTNLHLHASPPPSPLSTPNSLKSSIASLPPPSPLPTPIDFDMAAPTSSGADSSTVSSDTHEDPLAGVPELLTYRTSSHEEQTDALKLIADSVAQQRQTANTALIFHPLNLSIAVAILALLARSMLDMRYDLITTLSTSVGVIMIGFAACRLVTQPYINAAEQINFDWLNSEAPSDPTYAPIVVVSKFGDEIIGACVLDWTADTLSAADSSKSTGTGTAKTKRHQSRKSATPMRALLRAWTVRLRYRRKGVGAALLECAVHEARIRHAESLEFADDHANSKRPLYPLYHASMETRETKARAALADAWSAGTSAATGNAKSTRKR